MIIPTAIAVFLAIVAITVVIWDRQTTKKHH